MEGCVSGSKEGALYWEGEILSSNDMARHRLMPSPVDSTGQPSCYGGLEQVALEQEKHARVQRALEAFELLHRPVSAELRLRWGNLRIDRHPRKKARKRTETVSSRHGRDIHKGRSRSNRRYAQQACLLGAIGAESACRAADLRDKEQGRREARSLLLCSVLRAYIQRKCRGVCLNG